MRRSSVLLGVGLAWWAALLATPALAEDDYDKIPVRVTITHVSEQGDGVDEDARALVRGLEKNNIRVKNARVVREVQYELAPGDGGSIAIGGGRKAHLQLMQVDGQAALVAVDVEGGVKVDAKVQRGGRTFVVDAGKVGDGKRLIQIDAE